MKKILVMSVSECFNYVLNYPEKKPYIIISIQDSQDGFGFTFCKTRYCIDVLTVYFDDIDRPVPGLKMFSEEQAVEIVDFIKRHEDIENIVIHCYSGQCRSTAVAAVISKIYSIDNVIAYQKPSPNMYVYRLLLEKFESKK